MTTPQQYDRVMVSTCPAHNPTATDTLNRERGAAFSIDACWCHGTVQRVFADGNLLVSDSKGKLCLFPPTAVRRIS